MHTLLMNLLFTLVYLSECEVVELSSYFIINIDNLERGILNSFIHDLKQMIRINADFNDC